MVDMILTMAIAGLSAHWFFLREHLKTRMGITSIHTEKWPLRFFLTCHTGCFRRDYEANCPQEIKHHLEMAITFFETEKQYTLRGEERAMRWIHHWGQLSQ